MKKFIVLALATLISGQTMASNFTCEPHYRAKIDKLNKAMVSGTIPSLQVGASFAVPVAMGVAGLTFIAAAPVGVAIAISMFARDRLIVNKIDSIYSANEVIYESAIGKEAILAAAKEFYDQDQMILSKNELNEINRKREEMGLPEISLEDYLAKNPIPAFNPNSVRFAIDRLVLKMNMKEPGKYTFDSVASILKDLAMDDTLCPSGKPKGIKQITKMIKEQF